MIVLLTFAFNTLSHHLFVFVFGIGSSLGSPGVTFCLTADRKLTDWTRNVNPIRTNKQLVEQTGCTVAPVILNEMLTNEILRQAEICNHAAKITS